MPVVIGVPSETDSGERRLAVVPDVVKKYIGLGAQVVMQSGAGKPAHFHDAAFDGVTFVDSDAEVCAAADIILAVQPPSATRIGRMKTGAVLLGMLQPWFDANRIAKMQKKNITSFALELLPRITRSQSMDALSSQAAVSGYECALIAADHSPGQGAGDRGRRGRAAGDCHRAAHRRDGGGLRRAPRHPRAGRVAGRQVC